MTGKTSALRFSPLTDERMTRHTLYIINHIKSQDFSWQSKLHQNNRTYTNRPQKYRNKKINLHSTFAYCLFSCCLYTAHLHQVKHYFVQLHQAANWHPDHKPATTSAKLGRFAEGLTRTGTYCFDSLFQFLWYRKGKDLRSSDWPRTRLHRKYIPSSNDAWLWCRKRKARSPILYQYNNNNNRKGLFWKVT